MICTPAVKRLRLFREGGRGGTAGELCEDGADDHPLKQRAGKLASLWGDRAGHSLAGRSRIVRSSCYVDVMDAASLGHLHPRAFTSFEEVSREVEKFEQVLASNGITIVPGSALEAMTYHLLELQRRRANPDTIDPWEDIRQAFRPALGLHDLIRRILRVRQSPDFPRLIPHLRLLNRGTVAQNVSAPTDQVSAKIFELLIALVAIETGANATLDDPDHSAGDNPDVLVTFAGKRWGFACKVLGGTSPLTLYDRLEEGIRQIEDSEAEIGCVVFSMKNQIDHDLTWPLMNPVEYRKRLETPTFGAWRNSDDAHQQFLALAAQRHEQLIEVNSTAATEALFRAKKTIPAALLVFQSATSIRLSVGPTFTFIGCLVLMDLFGVAEDGAEPS